MFEHRHMTITQAMAPEHATLLRVFGQVERLSERAGVKQPTVRKPVSFSARVLLFTARWGQRALPGRGFGH